MGKVDGVGQGKAGRWGKMCDQAAGVTMRQVTLMADGKTQMFPNFPRRGHGRTAADASSGVGRGVYDGAGRRACRRGSGEG